MKSLITLQQEKYTDEYGKKAIDKYGTSYTSYSMCLKDWKTVVPMINEINTIKGLPTEEQYELIERILKMSLGDNIDISNIDYELANKIITNYIGGYNVYMNSIPLTSGSVIVDRFGVEHKVHSVLLKDMKKLRELLPKIDPIVTVNNVLDTDDSGEPDFSAYKALLEIIKMTLDEKQSKCQIEKWLDAEIARKIVKVALDLPVD